MRTPVNRPTIIASPVADFPPVAGRTPSDAGAFHMPREAMLAKLIGLEIMVNTLCARIEKLERKSDDGK